MPAPPSQTPAPPATEAAPSSFKTTPPKDGSLGGRAIGASAWSLTGFGTAQVLRFAGSLILTRLLVPEAFGTMALVHGMLYGLTMFSDAGIGPSIIRHERGDDPLFLRTAWTVQVMRGLLLWACCWLIAPFMAWFYREPILGWVLPATGLTAVMHGCNSISLFTLRRQMRLKQLTMIELSSQAVNISVIAGIAWSRPSVWALVLGNLAGSLTKTALSHLILPGIRHAFAWDRGARDELFDFGKWIFLNSSITFCALYLDRLALGKLSTMAQLGVYGTAVTIAQLPRALQQSISSTVVFPLVSKVFNDDARFVDTVSWVRRALLLCSAPMCAALLAGGRPLVELVYDPRYHQAGAWLSIASLGVWLEGVSLVYGTIILAGPTPRLLTWGLACRSVIFLLLVVPVFRAFDAAGQGVAGVVALAGISELGVMVMCARGARRLRVWKPAADLMLSLYFVGLAGVDYMAWRLGTEALGSSLAGLAAMALVSLAALAAAFRYIRRVARKVG